jgi:serine/threonine protein kinase/Tol biopolymer transport system component
MPLNPGDRLGAYQIVGRLGAGAMGEVYRARDTRLERDVALKILPAEFAANPERRRRFEQESRAASALNHPNIVSVYDAGDEQGVSYMVSELVDGESLRELISRGPVPLRKVLELAAQLADGLAAAHAAGVVHRDIKPENVMLTRDGRAKILDFGLARYQPAAAPEGTAATMTQAGMIMGTVGYMSPEQVTGTPADARSDIFSLGIVIHEMLTGKTAFECATSVETMSAILRADPPELPASVPAPLRQIVLHCLEKEPARRFQSAKDLAFNLHAYAGGYTSMIAPTAQTAVRRPRPLLPIATAALALLSIYAVAVLLMRPPGADLAAYRFTPFATETEYQNNAVWSPDGKNVAYQQISLTSPNSIMVRSVDSLVPTTIAKVNGMRSLFWSPDGSQLYFVLSDGVWSVSRAGGARQQVVKGPYQAAAISPDGKALMLWLGSDGTDEEKAKLWISSPPGAPVREYQPVLFKMIGTFVPVYLQFSPDGRQVLLSMFRGSGAQMWLLPFPDGASTQPRRILASQIAGADVPSSSWMADSRHLILAFDEAYRSRLWMADTAKETMDPLTADEGRKSQPSVSPDGKQILFTAAFLNFDLVEIPLNGDPVRPLLVTNRDELFPAWSPAGKQFAYVTNRDGGQEIWLKSVQEGWERPLVTQKDFPAGDEDRTFLTPSISPDGTRIAYSRVSTQHFGAIYISPVGGGSPIRLTNGNDYEIGPVWSPDGNWIVFFSSKGGLVKIKVGANEPPITLLSDGCESPAQWSPDGQWIACPSDKGVDLFTPEAKNFHTVGHRKAYVSWSRDGKELYALGEDNGTWKLGGINIQTGIERIISDLGTHYQFASPYSPSFPLSLSPDGTSLATSVENFKAEIWMLEGFRQPAGWFSRLLP